MLNSDEFLKEADIFALGASIYELARGAPLPTNGPEWQGIRAGHLSGLGQFSTEFQELLHSMMAPDPKARPSAFDLLQQLNSNRQTEAHMQIQDYQSEIYALRERVDQLVYTLDAMTEDTIPASKMAGTQTAFDQLLGSVQHLERVSRSGSLTSRPGSLANSRQTSFHLSSSSLSKMDSTCSPPTNGSFLFEAAALRFRVQSSSQLSETPDWDLPTQTPRKAHHRPATSSPEASASKDAEHAEDAEGAERLVVPPDTTASGPPSRWSLGSASLLSAAAHCYERHLPWPSFTLGLCVAFGMGQLFCTAVLYWLFATPSVCTW
jgi:serine/threonine protein kinase